MEWKRLMRSKPGLLRQTKLILLGALCASLLAALLLVGLLFQRTLQFAEQDQVRTSLAQAQSLLDLSLENLSRSCADWANRDESYRQITQGDSSILSRNLSPEVFSNNDLDFMAFLTLDGRLMEGGAFDRQQQQVRELTPALRASLAANGAIGRRLVAAKPNGAFSGLLLLDGAPTLLSLQPVRHSGHSGQSVGWLLWGQHASAVLERGYLSVLAHQAALRPAGVPLPAGQPLDAANSPLGSRMFTGADELRGYRFLTDLNGKPALLLETHLPRELLHQGNRLLVACFLALMAMLALFGALAFWTLRRRIGQRLDELRRGIGNLVTGNYGALLNIHGQDEVALIGNLIDRLVHSRVHANRRVETLRRHVRQVFDQSPNPMLIVRDLHILAVNPACIKLFGYRDDSQLVGQPLAALQDGAGVELGQAAELERRLMSAERYFEWEFTGRQGRRLPCELVVSCIKYQGLPAQQLFLRDLRDRKRQEHQITQLAYHDRLTGLANRFRLQQWVQARLDELAETGSDRSDAGFALLLVSLDEYKSINAAFGQDIADGVLRMVAERLCHLDVQASVARLDSDEFVVWLPEIVHPEQAMGLARTMQCQLAAAMQLDKLQLEMSTSIGVVVGGARYRLAQEVLQGASYAVRRAQEEGTGLVRLFNRELKRAATEEMCIRTDLPQAIRSGQLQPHFQPMIDCRNGHLLGFEALSRWQHPRLGDIPPARFIPIAETTEAIIDLGEHVLHAACDFIAAAESARQCSGPPLMVHVNISARHFASAALVDCIDAVIRSSGIVPSQLVIEITESLLMKRPQDSLATMRRIKELGVGLALDDFGTGYSSLSTLYEYPIDVVKLDRAFVWRVVDGGPGEHLVQAIVTMAHTLGFSLVAEGVETVQQQQKLHALGITAMQGFLFYRPLSRADALRAMATCQAAEPWLRADGATESPLLVEAASAMP